MYWAKVTNYENVQDFGKCTGIQRKVDIYIEGDAYISGIETEEGFYCSAHKINTHFED